MDKKFSRVLLVIVAGCVLGGCSTVKQDTEQQQAAKAKLYSENVPYSTWAFMAEASKGNVEHLKLFLEAGMDVNVHNNGTALTCAVYDNNLDAVKFLIDNGADVNEGAYWGTPLGIASYKDYYEIAELLIKSGADVNKISRNDMSPLFNAVLMKGRARIVELLLKNGADPNFKQEVTKETPLLLAAGKGYTDVVKLLVKGGSDINYEDTGGLSALDWALLGDHTDTAEFLLNNGATISGDGSVDIPMIIVMERKNYKIAELLLKQGADVNGKFGKMPLIVWCAKQNFNDSVKFLIDHGADLYAEDTAGNSALSYAMLDNNTELIDLIRNSIKSKEQVESNSEQVIASGKSEESSKTTE